MFPFLVEALSDVNIELHPSLTATAIDLLSSLIKNVNDPFPSVYTNQIFPRIAAMMLKVNDEALLQNGQEAFKLLVHRDFEGISTWNDGINDGSQYILKFVMKLLDVNTSESSALFVGDLITKLIQKGGSTLQSSIPSLLSAAVLRLKHARMPSFIQTLVLLFCHLIQSQLVSLLDFLISIKIDNQSGLEIVLEKWLGIFGEIQGFYAVKLSMAALVTLYLSTDQRLQQIQLQGDIILDDHNSNYELIVRYSYEI
jgi:hypothetical protein